MTTQQPRPYYYLKDAADRINALRGTPGDFALLQEGYLVDDKEMRYLIPNKHLSIKPSF